jgi:hypothetical protein
MLAMLFDLECLSMPSSFLLSELLKIEPFMNFEKTIQQKQIFS